MALSRYHFLPTPFQSEGEDSSVTTALDRRNERVASALFWCTAWTCIINPFSAWVLGQSKILTALILSHLFFGFILLATYFLQKRQRWMVSYTVNIMCFSLMAYLVQANTGSEAALFPTLVLLLHGVSWLLLLPFHSKGLVISFIFLAGISMAVLINSEIAAVWLGMVISALFGAAVFNRVLWLETREQILVDTRIADAITQMTMHDLKRPIHTMKMLGHLLAEERQPERLKELLQKMLPKLELMSQYAEGVAAKPRLNIQVTNVSAALDIAHSHIEPMVQNKNIKLDITGSDASVMMPAVDLSRVIMNLLENALIAAPVGSRVWCATSELSADIEIAIGNTGNVIPELQLGRIFHPNVKGASSSGQGLGLAIAHSLLHKSGGVISVSSTLELGTVFTIRLPKQPRDVRPFAAIIDDDPFCREFIVSKNPAWRFDEYANLGDFWTSINEKPTKQPKVVILDLYLNADPDCKEKVLAQASKMRALGITVVLHTSSDITNSIKAQVDFAVSKADVGIDLTFLFHGDSQKIYC